jgi:hypothetical protein
MGTAAKKETPRQKMIGMMYLFYTALLALQVSNSVLERFIFIFEVITVFNNLLCLCPDLLGAFQDGLIIGPISTFFNGRGYFQYHFAIVYIIFLDLFFQTFFSENETSEY